MGLKTFRPITPTLRFKIANDFAELTKAKPQWKLTEAKKRTGGRNHHGRITCRHIGGGHKQRYRIIDFKRSKRDVEAKVVAIEYDPNRTCRIALLRYVDGSESYILAPLGISVGETLIAGSAVESKPGNAMPISAIPLGVTIHNIELIPGRGGKVARSAGQQAILMNREGDYGMVKLPSGEIRKIHVKCYATIGQIGHVEHMNTKSGKAGRSRWLGIRPTVRGMVMNPIDHPMGGGQGKSKGGGGRHHPVSPWGQLAKGFKTRRKHKSSDQFIVERRNAKKAK